MADVKVVASPEIWHRDDMPLLCNWRKLWRAAEVGVDRAEYATMFLSRWQGHQYWGIDDYQPYPEMPHDREADFHTAVARLAPHGMRARLIRASSADAAGWFYPDGLDFVYIDAAHDHESVRKDLDAWWPAVAPGGILAGHDWDDFPAHEGVKRAVKGLASRVGATIYITDVRPYRQEDSPSWYLYKSGMPGPDWRRC